MFCTKKQFPNYPGVFVAGNVGLLKESEEYKKLFKDTKSDVILTFDRTKNDDCFSNGKAETFLVLNYKDQTKLDNFLTRLRKIADALQTRKDREWRVTII